MEKRVIKVFAVLCMAFILLSVNINAASAVTSGSCGANVIWEFDIVTGTLTISGTGDMSNYSSINTTRIYIISSGTEHLSGWNNCG